MRKKITSITFYIIRIILYTRACKLWDINRYLCFEEQKCFGDRLSAFQFHSIFFNLAAKAPLSEDKDKKSP